MESGELDFKGIVNVVADILREMDSESPVHKGFKPGIGPFGEPQIVKKIAQRLSKINISAKTKRCPDLKINENWAIEFKIVRPFGDNGKEAENWSVNLLHPYRGNVSLIGDAFKLLELDDLEHKGLLMLGYEHNPAIIDLAPLILSFEVLMTKVMKIKIEPRIEVRIENLIHPVHQVLRCVGWELTS